MRVIFQPSYETVLEGRLKELFTNKFNLERINSTPPHKIACFLWAMFERRDERAQGRSTEVEVVLSEITAVK